MFLSFLSVVSVWSVLARIMLLDKQRIHCCVRIHGERHKRHFSALFHYFGIVDGVVGRSAPRERTVVLDQYARRVVGVYLSDIQELVNYHIACFQLILTFNFGLCHIACARNVLVEIVGVSGADIRNVAACLRKRCSIG